MAAAPLALQILGILAGGRRGNEDQPTRPPDWNYNPSQAPVTPAPGPDLLAPHPALGAGTAATAGMASAAPRIGQPVSPPRLLPSMVPGPMPAEPMVEAPMRRKKPEEYEY